MAGGLITLSAVLTGLLRVVGGFAAEKQLGRRWTIGGVVLGTLEAVLGVLLLASTELRPEVIWPVAAAWGVVSGSLLLAEGVRLRRFARAST